MVLLNMVVKHRTETGPTITRPGERSLEFLEGHFLRSGLVTLNRHKKA